MARITSVCGPSRFSLGRSDAAYAAWLARQHGEFTVGIDHGALAPFRGGYHNAIL